MKIRTISYFAATILLTLGIFASTSFAQARQVVSQGSINRVDTQRSISVEADNELFRRELTNYYSEVIQTLTIFNEYGVTRASLNKESKTGVSVIDQMVAKQNSISAMSSSEIAILRSSTANTDIIRAAASNLHSIRVNEQLRDTLAKADRANDWLNATRKSGDGSGNINLITDKKAIIPDVCPDPNLTPSQIDIGILKGVTAAAEGVMEALPTDFLTFEAHAAAAVIVTAAKIAEIALDVTYEIAQNCQEDVFRAKVIDGLEVDLRLKIEANLSGLGAPVLLFYIPENIGTLVSNNGFLPEYNKKNNGGWLDLSRSIVEDSITKANANGIPVAAAQSYYTQAVAKIAAGQYKQAYAFLRLAYQQIVQ